MGGTMTYISFNSARECTDELTLSDGRVLRLTPNKDDASLLDVMLNDQLLFPLHRGEAQAFAKMLLYQTDYF